jgi:hypothetical protein
MDKPRTLAQNKAMHLWFTLLAKDLNDAGLSIMRTFKATAEIPWTEVTIKELLFKQFMKVMFNKTRTRDLTTKELNEVSETLIRYLGEKHSLETEFPSIESLMIKQYEN